MIKTFWNWLMVKWEAFLNHELEYMEFGYYDDLLP